ncbi:MAG: UDP-3-O-(3-hydroxymyristoyl)glucosamine N-acyltransferase [Pseudomonadota bacterium]
MTTLTLKQIADFIGCESSENPGPAISGVKPLEYATSSDVTYVSEAKFIPLLKSSKASAVLISADMGAPSRPYVRSKNPEADYARLTELFYGYIRNSDSAISEHASVDPTAIIGANVSIGPFSVVGPHSVIGEGSSIGAHVVIGENVLIGESTIIFPNVTIYREVKIGSRVIVHSGSVIGSDGFGYARDVDSDGSRVNIKKFHSGSVEIQDDVEIGSLTAIDRGLAGVTTIHKGAKIDNLVQIAHNVSIGAGTVIASQVGIAGSSSVGSCCMIGGQVGVRDHVSVGNGVILATRVGIYRNVSDGSVMAGSVPAMPHRIFLRAQSLFKRLPEMLDRIRNLERIVKDNTKEIS